MIEGEDVVEMWDLRGAKARREKILEAIDPLSRNSRVLEDICPGLCNGGVRFPPRRYPK